jgi:hypothetical protein
VSSSTEHKWEKHVNFYMDLIELLYAPDEGIYTVFTE